MSPNAFVSNGTCYSGPGERAARDFLPCGNDALGHKTCCQSGDMCLSSEACYNGVFGVTYRAGCSDPDFKDASCPDKQSFRDDPWVGLVRCNDTNDWIQCSQSGRQSTITKPDDCSCPETSRTVAFTDSSKLPNVVMLPTQSGGSVIWQPGYVPTNNGDGGGNGGGPSPTAPPPPPPPPGEASSHRRLSPGARAGIGIGVAALVLLLSGAFVMFLMRQRRRAKQEQEQKEKDQQPPPTASELDSHEAKVEPSELGGTPRTPVPSELEPRPAGPWSLRSELADSPSSLGAALDKSQGPSPEPQPGGPGHPSKTSDHHVVAELPG